MPSSGRSSSMSTTDHQQQSDVVVVDSPRLQVKSSYRVVVMGSARVGKTALINRFLYESFLSKYKPTVEELHRGEYNISGSTTSLVLDILDTSGAYQFPAMRALSISKADAFVLVYAVDDQSSFDEVRQLRELILQSRLPEEQQQHHPEYCDVVPIVVVANKNDLDQTLRQVPHETAETMVCVDWEHPYVETSAKNNDNVVDVFKVLLSKANIPFGSPLTQRRRQSLPASLHNGGTGRHGGVKRQLLKRHSCNVS